MRRGLLRPLRSLQLAIVAAALGFYAIFIERVGFRFRGKLYFTLFDDAMVSMRFARNLASGHGLVWNAGAHPVEGYSNFLWTLWMALVHLAGIPESKTALAVMVSGALLLVANILVVGVIARHMSDHRAVPLLAMSFTAFYYPLVYWTLRGMEVGLLTLLLSCAILLVLRLQARFRSWDIAALAVVCVALQLTRTDAIVFSVIVSIFVIATLDRRMRLRAAIVLGAAVVGTLAAQTAFRLAYYGLPLPNTYYLKLEGISLATRMYRGVAALAGVELVHLWAPTLLAAALLVAGRRAPRGAWLLMAVFLGGCAYSLYVGGDAWEWSGYSNRYITPGVPALLILSALAIEQLILRRRTADRRKKNVVAGAFVAVFLLSVSLNAWLWLPFRRFALEGTPPVQVLALAFALLFVWSSSGQRAMQSISVAATRPVLAAVVGLLALAAVNAAPLRSWVQENAVDAKSDAQLARYGLALREATAPGASIAVIFAGQVPYFSHRRSVDLLGKSDHVVATTRPRGPFVPGHDKWNYAYSVGRLRPDLLAQIWLTPTASRLLRQFDYRRLYPNPANGKGDPVFVRVGDRRVRLARLERLLAGARASLPRRQRLRRD